MPLYADTVAVRRFAAFGRLDLLRAYRPEMVIASTVLMELGKYRAAVEAEIAKGWIRVETPSISEVDQLRRGAPELDQGEAEVLALFLADGTHDSRLLIDEGNAHSFIHRALPNRRHKMRCVAQVFHELEEPGDQGWAEKTFKQFVTATDYRWAGSVRRDYEEWCEQEDLVPFD